MKVSLTSLPVLDFGLSWILPQPLAMIPTISAGESTQEEGLAERKIKKAAAPLRRSCELAFGIRIGRVSSDDMADPSQGSTTAYPQTRCNDQPEDGSQELTVVDLPHPRNKEAQDSRGARVFHHCLSQSQSASWGILLRAFTAQAVCRKVERHESYSGTAGGSTEIGLSVLSLWEARLS
jgi:hypothetical protein